MTEFPHDGDVDPILKAIVYQKAQRMEGRAGITNSDIQDVVQYLYEKLLKHFSIDAKNSPRGALLNTVIDRALANYIRFHEAQKRKSNFTISLSIVVDVRDGEGPVELADTISDHELDARRELHRRSDHERWECAYDVAAMLAKLSPKERDLCQRLMQDSVSQVARDLGIPRTTVHDRIRRLRKVFQTEKLSEYL